MNINEKEISEIVRGVLSEMGAAKQSPRKQLGVFDTMEEAIAAVDKAYTLFRNYNKEQREKIISEIRKLFHYIDEFFSDKL